MPNHNEFANMVNNSSHVSTLTHDTGKEGMPPIDIKEFLLEFAKIHRGKISLNIVINNIGGDFIGGTFTGGNTSNKIGK